MSFMLGSTIRLVRPYPNIFAFYDGRLSGIRAYSDEPNWLDDGAFQLGCCTYALVDGDDALIFDTHISVEHAKIVRQSLADSGVKKFRVALSHWHPDHIAGLDVFKDCDIIANHLTAQALIDNVDSLERRVPSVTPKVHPTTIFYDWLVVQVGNITVDLRHLDIHTKDGTVALLPGDILLAGDTLEDPVTYVAEPDRLQCHLLGLERLASWPVNRILPSHGSVEKIELGGYDNRLIDATRRYVTRLLESSTEELESGISLSQFAADIFKDGGVAYFDRYEDVHRRNISSVLTARSLSEEELR